MPVDDGDAQVSVPASFSVYYPGQDVCELFSTPGAVFVAPSPTTMICPGHPHATFVLLVRTRQKPAVYAGEQPTILNGVPIYLGPSGLSFVTHFAPSLGVDVTANGPLARRIVNTLTRSPLAVARESGSAPSAPPGWHSVSFRGLSFKAPRSWPVTPTAVTGREVGRLCATSGVTFITTRVALSTDRQRFPIAFCPAFLYQGLQPPENGVEVDGGSENGFPFPVALSFSKHCLDLHGLTACPATSPAYSILFLRVTGPSLPKPVLVSIGLAGNGMVARTILYSLRAS